MKHDFLRQPNLVALSKHLAQTFPSVFDLDKLKLIGNGFSSYAVSTESGIIFRVAKNALAMEGHKKELNLLPRLRDQLHVQVPNPLWWAEPSANFPFGVIGYRMIPGIPFSLELVPRVELEQISKDLAGFLLALHNVPTTSLADEDISAPIDLSTLWRTVSPVLRKHLTKEEYGVAESWRYSDVPNAARHNFSSSSIHGDPWGENILLNETLDGMVGVIDFETLTVGDVARDFAAQKYVGHGFLENVVSNYERLGGEVGDQFADRLRWFSMLRELSGLDYAISYPESEELEDSMRKVKDELTVFA